MSRGEYNKLDMLTDFEQFYADIVLMPGMSPSEWANLGALLKASREGERSHQKMRPKRLLAWFLSLFGGLTTRN